MKSDGWIAKCEYNRKSWIWMACSWIACALTILASKTLQLVNYFKVVNGDLLYRAIQDKTRTRPVITISNHSSLCDAFVITGRINKHKERLAYKSGIGRLITEPSSLPIVIPLYMLGTDDVMPMKRPYYPRFGKKVTLVFGEPVTFSDELLADIQSRKGDADTWAKIAVELHEWMDDLQAKAEKIHAN